MDGEFLFLLAFISLPSYRQLERSAAPPPELDSSNELRCAAFLIRGILQMFAQDHAYSCDYPTSPPFLLFPHLLAGMMRGYGGFDFLLQRDAFHTTPCSLLRPPFCVRPSVPWRRKKYLNFPPFNWNLFGKSTGVVLEISLLN